ncbi:MAG: DUF2029 domain-containing protein [Bdellovibrionales bacterium]|nr:DUF2029 domain-containing protein [Bdellovibrionales bacterium]
MDRTLLFLISAIMAWMFQIHLRFNHVDYNTFHLAGSNILQGRFLQLYAAEVSGMGGFMYPLGAAYFFSIFSWLGEVSGRVVFYLLLAFCLITVLRWCNRTFGDPKVYRHALCVTLLLGFRSLNDSWISGNISVLLLALTIGAFIFYQQKAPSFWGRHLSAAMLGFAISLKIFPIILMAYWVWARDFRHLFRVCAWSLGLLLFPYVMLSFWQQSTTVPMALFLAWKNTLASPASYGGADMIHFQNLSAFFHRVASFLGWGPSWITPSLVLTGAALTTLLMPQKNLANDSKTWAFRFAVLLAWVPLLNPVSWHHLGVFYLPLIYCTAIEFQVSRRKGALVSLVCFFILYTLTGRSMIGVELHRLVSTASLPLLGILALVLPSTWQARQR